MSYTAEREQKYTEKLRSIINEMPPFCSEYFRGIADRTSVLTRYEYARDLRAFFKYISIVKYDGGKKPTELSLSDMDAITLDDLEGYIDYVGLYEDESGRPLRNGERSKSRKISALRSFFKYFFKKQKIANNVAALLETPKLHEKPIIRLEADEVANLLDSVDSGKKVGTHQQNAYDEHTRVRDNAILTLFLGTGIRVSELVGIDIKDVDFSTNGFKITRKGGSQVILYFSDEVSGALAAYLEERQKITPVEGSNDALFLSLQRRRISVRAVQKLVKKHCADAVPLKKITPHKLRSTYGTMLYHETGDIYVVADVLGHKDVNTTTKHYAAQTDERRRMASKKVKLRED